MKQTTLLPGLTLVDDPWVALDPKHDLNFCRSYLDDAESAALFEMLRDGIDWQQRQVFVGGQWRDQPRLIGWFGDRDYTYSKLRLEPTAFEAIAPLADLRDRVSRTAGVEFNCCLANYYRDGRDSIGMHSDDEPELGKDPVIASISLGGCRTFRLARKDKSARLSVPLNGGSLLVMKGRSQAEWSHGIDKEPGAEPRINLTFRRMK